MKPPFVITLLLLGIVLGGIAGYYAGTHQYIYSISGYGYKLDPATGKEWISFGNGWKALNGGSTEIHASSGAN